MASVDLDRLCHCLSSIAVDQLYSLGDEEFLCGLKIRGHPLPVVVSMIRGHLTAIRNTNSPSERDVRNLLVSNGQEPD
ncbi:hypothetical protein MRX96_047274 [Rhipicephalus microplus]